MKHTSGTAMPYSGFHGDEYKLDLEPYMDAALDTVVEAIILYGQFPAPRHRSLHFISPPQRVLFSLREWIAENVDEDELREFYVQQVTDFGADSDAKRLNECARIEKLLRAELADSQIVRDVAEAMGDEDAEAI